MDKTPSIGRDQSSDPQSSCKKLGMVVVSVISVFYCERSGDMRTIETRD